MKKVFVSGCYDILHAGHIQFFEDARALGDYLTVCFASDPVLLLTKKRNPSIPEDNKRILIGALRCVDEVVSSSDLDPVFDFKTHIERMHPDILAITEDDKNIERKQIFCVEREMQLVVLSKRNDVTGVSTTSILSSIKNIESVPLRIDFAGGWLDVPKFARPGSYIVNCTISPLVSLGNWPYHQNAGLGGSAAYAILQARNGVRAELDQGVGWQDPAIIEETGICVWRSGERPVLDVKLNPDWLAGRMMILWTGKQRAANDQTMRPRDFDRLAQAGTLAREAAYHRDVVKLAKAVLLNYEVQKDEGMELLPEIDHALGRKYLGAGHGGYALYLFEKPEDRDAALAAYKEASPVEPYIKDVQMI
jgi:cytidyltransferase-like protein